MVLMGHSLHPTKGVLVSGGGRGIFVPLPWGNTLLAQWVYSDLPCEDQAWEGDVDSTDTGASKPSLSGYQSPLLPTCHHPRCDLTWTSECLVSAGAQSWPLVAMASLCTVIQRVMFCNSQKAASIAGILILVALGAVRLGPLDYYTEIAELGES